MATTRSGEANRVARRGAEDVENIVRHLLRQPGLHYVQELSKTLERDPDYLQFHAGSVAIRINEILSRTRSGVPEVSESTVGKVVREAVARLRK
jgi:hypothetical protein